MAISPRGVVRSTSCLVLRWGFRGGRVDWRYFRFRQIQDGGAEDSGCAVMLKNSNGDIFAADHPIYSVFGARIFGVCGSIGAISGFAKSKLQNTAAGGLDKVMQVIGIYCGQSLQKIQTFLFVRLGEGEVC